MSTVTSEQLYILRTFSKELNVLMLLILADKPMGVGEIARLLGRQEKTIRGYLENLSAFNLVGRQSYQEGWIALGGKQLILGEPVKNTGLVGPTTTTLINDSVLTINDTSSSRESLSAPKPVKNTGLDLLPEKLPTDQEYRAKLTEQQLVVFDLCRWRGIGITQAYQFAISDYEIEYVIAMVDKDQPIGFLVKQLRERDEIFDGLTDRVHAFLRSNKLPFIVWIAERYGLEDQEFYFAHPVFSRDPDEGKEEIVYEPEICEQCGKEPCTCERCKACGYPLPNCFCAKVRAKRERERNEGQS